MKTLRLKKDEDRYQAYLKAGKTKNLWDVDALVEYKYFKVIINEYPHSRVAEMHHLLIPKRRIDDWRKMNRREMREFKKLHDVFDGTYDCIKLNYSSIISVRNIVHWHLIRFKR